MDMNIADTTPMAVVSPTHKKAGRKPTAFSDNKPIDPKYYVNYHHNVSKQKDHPCPHCKNNFACEENLDRHLSESKSSVRLSTS